MKSQSFEHDKFYHVFNQGNNKENIFKEAKNYFHFLKLMKRYLLPIAEIYCYCLMPNHFHLILKIKNSEQIESDLQNKKLHQPFSNLFNSYTKSINKAYNRTGSLFREHLHKHWISNVEYLKNLILYVHLNPEKHGFADSYQIYNFSSYKSIISKGETNLERKMVIDLFDDLENFIICHQERKIRIDGILEEIESVDL